MAKAGGSQKMVTVNGVRMAVTISNKKDTASAIKFWAALQDKFPYNRVQTHIDSLAKGKADWYRSYGLIYSAVSNNSNSNRGVFSPSRYEENLAIAMQMLHDSGLMLTQLQD